MNSEHVDQIATALAKAQGEMKAATFNKENPHFKSRYADLAAVWEAIREPLSKNGLSVIQVMENGNSGGFNLVTCLFHSSGQFVRSCYPLPQMAKPQELGSALTYARRYSLAAIVGIASEEDDDANEAQKAPVAKPAVPVVSGEPREIALGDSPDWAWFARQMVDASASDKWPEWRSANMVNMNRMQSESPKVYALMLAQLQKTRG